MVRGLPAGGRWIRTIGTPQNFLAARSPIHLPQHKPAPSRQGPMVRIHLPPAESLLRTWLSKEGLGGGKVAVLTQHHVDQGASAIDRAIQIPPTTTRFHQLPPIEGVAEALASLTLPICVASSSNLEQIRQKLEITGLLGRFGEHLFSATMVARGKPAPDLFLYAAQHLMTAPDRCLIIEDSPAGIDAALAAGMTAIGFAGGSHCGPEHGVRLQRHGAALVMDHILELATTIAKLA